MVKMSDFAIKTCPLASPQTFELQDSVFFYAEEMHPNRMQTCFPDGWSLCLIGISFVHPAETR